MPFGYDWPQLHAALNDLPTALLLLAVLFEIASLIWKRESLRNAGYWTLLAGAVGGVLAVLSGLQAEDHIQHGEAIHEIMETHEKLALTTLGIFAVLAVWRLIRERKMLGTERALALVLGLVGLGFMVATAREGGELMFEHAAGVPTATLEAEIRNRAEGHHHHPGEADDDHDADADHDHADADHHDHDEAAPAAATDSAHADSAHADSAKPHTHTHAPGTPPHKD
jgi:uncharacterized membrane protein